MENQEQPATVLDINLVCNVVNCKEEGLQQNVESVINGVKEVIKKETEMSVNLMNLQINLFIGTDGLLAFQNQINFNLEENDNGTIN